MEWCWRTESDRNATAIKRVSSHKQGDGISPSVQEEEIRKYCAERNLNIVKIVNLEESAKVSENRSEYARELKNILRSKIRHIIYYASDRESRNLTDLEATNDLIKAGKIVVHHVNDRKVYWKGSTSNDYFIRYILGARNANFSDNLSERVIDALTTKSKLGWYPHARPPLGYIGRRHTNEYGKESSRGLSIVVPDPNEDAVSLVKREFELRALGYGYKEIRRRIVSEGWKFPRSIKNYTAKSIEYRLKCRFYYGYFKYRDVEYQGNHELIIPADVLRRVKRSFEHGDFYKRKHEKEAVFGGWIRCGNPDCNNVIFYNPKRKFIKETGETRIYDYYHCANSKLIHESMKGQSITEEELWATFEKALPSISISEELAADIMHAMIKHHKEATAHDKKQAEATQKAIAELDKKDDLAYENFESGAIDLPMYMRQCEKNKAERERISATLDSTKKNFEVASFQDVRKTLELCKDLKSLWNELNREKRVKLLKMLYWNPKLTNGTLEFNLRKPLLVISKIRTEEVKCPRPDLNWYAVTSAGF
jgi:hypothetical protein